MHDWFCSTSYHIKLVSGLYHVQCINLNINKRYSHQQLAEMLSDQRPQPLADHSVNLNWQRVARNHSQYVVISTTHLQHIYGRRLASILAVFQHKSMIAKYILAGLNLSRLSLKFSLIYHRQLCKFFFKIISYIIATENENYKVGLSLVTSLTLHVVIWQHLFYWWFILCIQSHKDTIFNSHQVK